MGGAVFLVWRLKNFVNTLDIAMLACVSAIKPGIVDMLEKKRDEELTERRDKRQKEAEEQAAKKAAENEKKTESGEQKMEVL